jgi:maltodextrin utilization protein YvdJ
MLKLRNHIRWIVPLAVLLVLVIALVVVPIAAHAASAGPDTMWPYH